jgi:THO complex subunit 5
MAIDTIVTDPELGLVVQTARHAREQAAELVDSVSVGLQSGGGALGSEAQSNISHHQKLLFTNVSHLRGLHRAAHLKARETKALTAEARQEVDRLHLQLQNLYYEQKHLQGEIQACESYEYACHVPTLPILVYCDRKI